ncbi:MAG TPA: hypothetical protein VHH53_12680 [Pseudonocardiaceae bacterium]|nr:hypothetical protein [Pseudonocardiaceae bacterium]
MVANTPLWFYILKEAEINGGKLGAVGGWIVAEVFHRAMEVSTHSIVRKPQWRPTFCPDRDTFRMVDLRGVARLARRRSVDGGTITG